MDHPTGMRIGIDRLRHRRHRQDFGILIRHGFDIRFGFRHDVIAKLGSLRLQRHIFQPEQLVGKPVVVGKLQ